MVATNIATMNTTPDNITNCCSERDELDWLAFRYVSNEMSASEILDFEGRLIDELPAQEAVARAVEMTHAVVSAMEPSAVPSKPVAARGRRQLWWAVAATSAAVAAVFASFFIGQKTGVNKANAVAKKETKQQETKQNGVQPVNEKSKVNDAVAAKMVEAWSNSSEDAQSDPPAVMQKPIKIAALTEETETVEEGEFDWVVDGLGGTATLSDDGK